MRTRTQTKIQNMKMCYVYNIIDTICTVDYLDIMDLWLRCGKANHIWVTLGPHMNCQDLKMEGNAVWFSNSDTSFGPGCIKKICCVKCGTDRRSNDVSHKIWLSPGWRIKDKNEDQTRLIIHSGLSARGPEHLGQMSASLFYQGYIVKYVYNDGNTAYNSNIILFWCITV